MRQLHLPHDWHSAPLPSNVRLGDGAWLWSAFAFERCRSAAPTAVDIGRHSAVYKPSHFNLGRHGSVSIGAYCTVVGAIIDCECHVEIGDYSLVSHDVTITDDEFAAPGHPRGQPSGGAILIGSDVWVGMGVTIIGPVTIGDGAIIGAKTVIRRDVSPRVIIAGDPPRVVGSVPRDQSP